MRFKALVLCVGLFCALAACTTPSYEYAKSTAVDEGQLKSDMSDCKVLAEKRTGIANTIDLIDSCMTSKGYSVTRKDFGRYW